MILIPDSSLFFITLKQDAGWSNFFINRNLPDTSTQKRHRSPASWSWVGFTEDYTKILNQTGRSDKPKTTIDGLWEFWWASDMSRAPSPIFKLQSGCNNFQNIN